MSLVLILSSHVAASSVGGSAQVVALAQAVIDTILVPTVLFGRHPGLGPPGGGAVGTDLFEGVLEGVKADGAYGRLQAVITGYFASPEQVTAAAHAIDAIKAVNPPAQIIVDPILGDSPKGLYVDAEVALAIKDKLVPRAGLLAPNAWELAWLTGKDLNDPVAAARSLGRPVLVSSIQCGDDIGVIYVDANQAWLATHRRAATAPNGTGDLLTARFTACLLAGDAPRDALQSAVETVATRLLGPTTVRSVRL